MEQLKNIWFYVLWTLDELTYFLPDVFLVLAILSIGNVDFIVTIMLFITYLATSYGEYQYFKNKIAREQIGKLMKNIKDVQEAMKSDEQKFVTFDGLLTFADIVEGTIDDKIQELREEVKGVANNEMDIEESEKEVQRG